MRLLTNAAPDNSINSNTLHCSMDILRRGISEIHKQAGLTNLFNTKTASAHLKRYSNLHNARHNINNNYLYEFCRLQKTHKLWEIIEISP